MNRRDLLKALLLTPLAAVTDFDQLLWMPRPMITVPAMPPRFTLHPDAFALVMREIESWGLPPKSPYFDLGDNRAFAGQQ